MYGICARVLWLCLILAMSEGAVRCAEIVSPSPSPVPRAGQALSDAWWTGPLLAPSAGTLPRGHVLVEPYLYDVNQYGVYDSHGVAKAATRTHSYGSLTYVIYGLTDRFNVGVIPVFGYTTTPGGPNSSGIGMGDWAVLAQYRLTQYQRGRWMPTTSLAIQESLPTGKYDNLGTRPSDGAGSGAYSTKVALYTQTYFWMPNGRILRARLNISDTFSGAVPLHGVSVYGTGAGFSGHVNPGTSLGLDAATEYSITQRWVFANDFVYTYDANTRVTANDGPIVDSGDSHSFAIAPAFEYNWSGNVGIIAGVRLYPSGINTAASLTPVIAVNYVH